MANKDRRTDKYKTDNIKAYTTVSNYIQLRISDLFFADCAILVEGAAERLLLPKAIQTCATNLRSTHYTIIEVGGIYAKHIIPLLEFIELPSIVITDIDSVENKQHGKKAEPKPSPKLKSANPTISEYVGKMAFTELLTLDTARKVHNNVVRICYQAEADGYEFTPPSKKYARTLEDALIYANAHLFASSTLKEHFQEPLIKKLLQEESDKDSIAERAYNIVSDNHFQKTTFAIDCTLVDGLIFPPYVQEGLLWLEQVVSKKDITANS